MLEILLDKIIFQLAYELFEEKQIEGLSWFNLLDIYFFGQEQQIK